MLGLVGLLSVRGQLVNEQTKSRAVTQIQRIVWV